VLTDLSEERETASIDTCASGTKRPATLLTRTVPSRTQTMPRWLCPSPSSAATTRTKTTSSATPSLIIQPMSSTRTKPPRRCSAPGASRSRDHKRMCGFIFLRAHRTGSRALSLQRGSLLDTILRIGAGNPAEMWEDTLARLRQLQPSIGDIVQLKGVRDELETRMSRL